MENEKDRRALERKKRNTVLPEDIKIHSHMDELASQKRHTSEEVSAYFPDEIIAELFYMHLHEKYKQSCLIHDYANSGLVLFVYPQLTEEYDYEDDEEANKRIIKNICNCIENNVDMLIISISIIYSPSDTHANLLIYRKQHQTIEVFEPNGGAHGSSEEVHLVSDGYSQLALNINNNLSAEKKITLLQHENVCPIMYYGLQSLESESELQYFEKEGGGYCAAWCLFFAETVLMNPTMTSKEIWNSILKKMHLQPHNDPADYLRYVIRGYIFEIKRAIERQLKIICRRDISYDDFCELQNKEEKGLLTKEEQEMIDLMESNFKTLHSTHVSFSKINPEHFDEKSSMNHMLNSDPQLHSLLTDYRRNPDSEKQSDNAWQNKATMFPKYPPPIETLTKKRSHSDNISYSVQKTKKKKKNPDYLLVRTKEKVIPMKGGKSVKKRRRKKKTKRNK